MDAVTHSAHGTPEPASWLALADTLARVGWVEQRDFLPGELVTRLYEDSLRAWEEGELHKAGIGRGDNHLIVSEIRGDYITWLEAQNATPAQREFLALMDAFRRTMNRELFLGLEEYEVMSAYYPAGTRYGKHLDRFQDSSERTLTTVIYLNPDWLPEHGGQLRIYKGEEWVDVLPRAGTLASFITDGTWHEVLPATRPRLSLTGWFRRRSPDELPLG